MNAMLNGREEATAIVRSGDFACYHEALVPLSFSQRDGRAAKFQRVADEKKARIQKNGALSEAQRRSALQMLRQQTEAEMRGALGDRNFHAFQAFHQWWFREISTVN